MKVLAFFALIALSGTLAAQSTYRWVDEQGRVHYSDQPPPAQARQAQEVPATGTRPDPVPGYAVRKAAADFPVTLYTAESCTDPCAQARALFTERGVPFTEKPVRSQEDLAAYRRVFGEPDEVPAATIGRLPFRGFEAAAWQRALDQAGYPRKGPSSK